jgi:hypothetical protein
MVSTALASPAAGTPRTDDHVCSFVNVSSASAAGAAAGTEGAARSPSPAACRSLRDGNAFAIAHLYSVLINEHMLLAAGGESSPGRLTSQQFHALIDGALRIPDKSH